MIGEFEAREHVKLPPDYIDFLRKMNGGEGEFGEAYLQLWDLDRIAESKKFFEAEKFWPGFLAFGSDGGGEAFGFDLRADAKEVVAIRYDSPIWEDSIRVAPTFTTFLDAMYKFGPDALFANKIAR